MPRFNMELSPWNGLLEQIKSKGLENLRALEKSMLEYKECFQEVRIENHSLRFVILGQKCALKMKVIPVHLFEKRCAYFSIYFLSNSGENVVEVEVEEISFDRLGNIGNGDVDDYFCTIETKLIKKIKELNLPIYL